MLMAVTDLPEPDSPTMRQHLAGLDGEVDAADGLHHAVLGAEVDREVLDGRAAALARPSSGEGVGHQASFTSRASRRPSPTSRKPSTVRTMARPGKNSRCGAVLKYGLRLG